MSTSFQISLRSQIILAVILAMTTSFSIHHSPNNNQPVLNTSFLEQTNHLLQPIIIPNLTSFADSLFPTVSKPNQTQNSKVINTDENNYFIKRIFYPDEGSAASQESIVRTKYENEELNRSETSPRFSSRYSSRQQIDQDSTENKISSKESEENSNEKLIPDSTERLDSLENEAELARNDVIQDDIYKTYSESSENPYPTHYSYREEEKQDREYSNVNGPRETEDSEISPTTNEPYTELRRPTSFPESRYQEEEVRNYETPSTTSEERDVSREEEKDNKNDYHDSSSKNYHSIQTPLEDIKFRGPHSYDDEYEKTRTRLSPISRHPISHNWPYSEAHLKVEADKLNEIPDSEEREDSDEVISSRAETSSKLSDLERVAKRDESELRKSNNYVNIGDYRKEKQNLLAVVEEKDHQTPFFQSIKQYKVEEEEPKTHPTVNLIRKPQPQFKVNDKLWSTSSSLTDKGNPIPYSKLFSKHTEPNKLSKFNITKELSNFQGHQYLGPVVFDHNDEGKKFKPTTQPQKLQKQPSRNIFVDELVKKEDADRKNLASQKLRNTLLGTPSKDLPPSFSYQKESDEMYNQILASIQSVFGTRTQPLKSASTRKSVSGPHQELSLEENKSFTWAVPLRKQENVNQVTSESPALRGSERSGSEGKSDFIKSVYPTDILGP